MVRSQKLYRVGILKFSKDSGKLFLSIEIFVDWISNKIPPWAVYHAFMSVHLIAHSNQPGIHPVGVRKNWIRLFAKCVLKAMETEATNVYLDGQLCTRLNTGIYMAIYGVQAIWDANFSTENWVFLLVNTKTCSIKTTAL